MGTAVARNSGRITVGKRGGKGRTRQSRRNLQPYGWLGAGALTLGVGAALATGTAVAHADTDDSAGSAGRASVSDRPAANRTSDKARGSHGAGVRSKPASTIARPESDAAPGVARAAATVRPAASVVSPASVATSAVVPGAAAASTPVGAPDVFSFFFSDGTAGHPNAGLIGGNGYSWTDETCTDASSCTSGRAGLIYGNGGNGYAGGAGGSTGWFGNGGDGGDGVAWNPVVPAVGVGGTGGAGGNGGLFYGNGGKGGAGGDAIPRLRRRRGAATAGTQVSCRSSGTLAGEAWAAGRVMEASAETAAAPDRCRCSATVAAAGPRVPAQSVDAAATAESAGCG